MTNPTAPEHLQAAKDALDDRAASRDTPGGERSMARAVDAFNLMFDQHLTATEGWQFMVILKMARGAQGEFRADDYTDQAAYSALAGEEAGTKTAESMDYGEIRRGTVEVTVEEVMCGGDGVTPAIYEDIPRFLRQPRQAEPKTDKFPFTVLPDTDPVELVHDENILWTHQGIQRFANALRRWGFRLEQGSE